MSHLWIDATAGVAGDMLLGALVDAGAGLDDIQAAVDAVLPGTVRLTAAPVTRAGLRALKVDVEVLVDDQPHRTWRETRTRLHDAPLADAVRRSALAVFGLLAEAEARVHGVGVDEVHFHEVGAWDSIADVVGVVTAVHLLGVDSTSASPVALGSGRTRTAHGDVPVPAPATLELAKGWQVGAGGEGELATPTGLALVRGLATMCEPLPPLVVAASGVGAGTKDVPGRPNVVRVVCGTPASTPNSAGHGPGPGAGLPVEELWVLDTNVDDLDPRVWPEVLAALVEAGAADAWLTPILMKKGRPAHTLSVLCSPHLRDDLRDLVFSLTTTFGVREHAVSRAALGRSWRTVVAHGHPVRVKISTGADGRIRHVTPEFEDARRAARESGAPVHAVLAEAEVAAREAGLLAGAELRGPTTGQPTSRTSDTPPPPS
jgi:uncharacterized protein (TIGR00299 family) protein